MISYRAIRGMFQGRLQEALARDDSTAGYRAGCLAFVSEMHDTLGVACDPRTGPRFLLREDGVPYKAPHSAGANELELRPLADALMGHEFVQEYFHPSSGFSFGEHGAWRVLEAAIDPSAFLNVSTFNLTVAGLVNAQIMERFSSPQYIGRELISIKPTQMNGHKIIGVSRIPPYSKTAKGRQPGEEHVEIGFSEMYSQTPETQEQALKCKLTKEAVYFNLTGQVTETAGEVGDELAYGQEKDIADGVMGASSSYNLNGTFYGTYQPTSPFVNDQSNQFQDITSVDKARQQMVNATDPITGREIEINTYNILCFPFQELKFRSQLFGPNIQIGTQQSAGNFPTYITAGGNALNSVGRGTYQLTPLTAIWRNRALAVDGLNLAGPVADLYWWLGDFKRAFQWDENWAAQPWQATADELVMKDRGLIGVFGANYRGVFYANEPRYAYRQRN